MLSKDNVLPHLKKHLPKLAVGGAMEVLTYKRNRGFLIEKEANDIYHLTEHGYEKIDHGSLPLDALLKEVARILKREFPRSQQVRLYNHAPESDVRIKNHPDIRI